MLLSNMREEREQRVVWMGGYLPNAVAQADLSEWFDGSEMVGSRVVGEARSDLLWLAGRS